MGQVGEFIINHWILVSAFVVLAYLVFSDLLGKSLSGLRSVGVTQAVQLVNQQKGVFVDVREQDEFAREHIADSISIPLSKLPQDNRLKDKRKPVIVVCATGQRAKTAAKQLKEKGLENVFILAGGLVSWKEAKLPLFSDKS